MRSENVFKKVDSLGRVVLPKSLRQRYEIVEGDELEVFSGEAGGKAFICLAKRVKGAEDPRYKIAREVLQELGVPLPESLMCT